MDQLENVLPREEITDAELGTLLLWKLPNETVEEWNARDDIKIV